MDSHLEFLHKRPDLAGHDEQDGDDRTVVVSVDDETHLLEAAAEVARVVDQTLDAGEAGAFAVHDLAHGGDDLENQRLDSSHNDR